ncbi:MULTISPECIES: histidine kinase dimerization/phospho-acceptor domain-containing protein [Corallococcus]|uniref:histidine kinase dimerization/phospho-acceptor domain-containing protein n=1 Tax=Corallococcus TaxID=83461 RepID=UPI0013156FE5|nr:MULTISPECIES: histidine kinase dimerization/phospho-acceptor domain-containing protein [Corallococcus]NRD47332.1 HAMP domain-containing histidine kinase [Corallococcus exiguus]
METTLTAVAEQALRKGTRAGLEALLKASLRLTGATGAALYEGRVCVMKVGNVPARRADASKRSSVLETWPAPLTTSQRSVVARFSAFAPALLAAHAREVAQGARQARLLEAKRRLERTVAVQDKRRSRAAHDLRTPLMVIKGYVDMMLKGTGGPLGPQAQRYLERIAKVAADQKELIDRRLAPPVPGLDDLRPVLTRAFAPTRGRAAATLTLPAERTVPVRGARADWELLARTLARGTVGAVAVDVHLGPAQEDSQWLLRVRACPGTALTARTQAMLQQLTERLGGTMAVAVEPRLEVTLVLPGDDAFPVPTHC